MYVVAASSRSVAVRKLQQTLVVDQLIQTPTSPCGASIVGYPGATNASGWDGMDYRVSGTGVATDQKIVLSLS